MAAPPRIPFWWTGALRVQVGLALLLLFAAAKTAGGIWLARASLAADDPVPFRFAAAVALTVAALELWSGLAGRRSAPRREPARRVGAALLLMTGAVLLVPGLIGLALISQRTPTAPPTWTYAALMLIPAVLSLWAAFGLWPAVFLTQRGDPMWYD